MPPRPSRTGLASRCRRPSRGAGEAAAHTGPPVRPCGRRRRRRRGRARGGPQERHHPQPYRPHRRVGGHPRPQDALHVLPHHEPELLGPGEVGGEDRRVERPPGEDGLLVARAGGFEAGHHRRVEEFTHELLGFGGRLLRGGGEGHAQFLEAGPHHHVGLRRPPAAVQPLPRAQQARARSVGSRRA